jgi:hypothetical protein
VLHGIDRDLWDTRVLRVALWSFCAFMVLLLVTRLGPPNFLMIPLKGGLAVSGLVALVAGYIWIWALWHAVAGRTWHR